MFQKCITVNVSAADEIGRHRIVRQLRTLPGVSVVREQPAVDILLMGRHDRDAPAELRRLARAGRAPLVVVADDLGETELMAVSEYGVQCVLWSHRLTPGRLQRAVHNAAGCCPRTPLSLALV
ncbi:DNA-binding NarL/FixJ family response regulator [Streptomyces olivoverticillatus]|uniref:DNA-binding NarL/FixJ family response regulator n=1 Tax=Streptomyces olivoverticillatus TaxID=66427 RepID=A0A7W7LQ85_9ACTN|nr:DNA-binding response regulator [Streptomyces olivoverticillatus]MBB4893977.1 DNA-binding NarL/FixJ family response regulator [Streptomyces olivoverticillatus]